jgi:hypothetical protein
MGMEVEMQRGRRGVGQDCDTRELPKMQEAAVLK